MHAFAAQCIEIRRERGDERLAFTGLHLGNIALMQHQAAQHLHMVGPHAQHAGIRLTDGCKRFRKNVVLGFAVGQTLSELSRFGLELFIRQFLVCFFQVVHFFDDFLQLFQLGGIASAQKVLHKFKHVFSFMGSYRLPLCTVPNVHRTADKHRNTW